MSEQKIKRKRDKNDVSSSISKVTSISKENYEEIRRMDIEIFNLAETLKVIIEAEKINQSLQIQDEEDRHSIALWGLNKTYRSEHSPETKTELNESPEKNLNSSFGNQPSFLNSSREFPNPTSK
uniref:Uncharacterized protein n=1 Tax=Euplotes harpa TaxID=151035 RepID=A0A7S3NFD4_9SPIT|mmetsp:Transcript_6698/g.7637  ORF Transcript_6698/g.7637 Transcript_6698/m.7637 type:complete len:124 (+) Transcript_6698:108-479(+)